VEFDLGRIVSENRSSATAYEKALSARIREAESSIPRIRDELLDRDPSIRRIVLFGSLATGTVRDLSFDIDIALSGALVFKLAAWGEDQAIPVDIVDYDALTEEFRADIDRLGAVLYAKTD
jgi:predicted nucleotidyltransferase